MKAWGFFSLICLVVVFFVSLYLLLTSPDPDQKLGAGVFLGIIVIGIVITVWPKGD